MPDTGRKRSRRQRKNKTGSNLKQRKSTILRGLSGRHLTCPTLRTRARCQMTKSRRKRNGQSCQEDQRPGFQGLPGLEIRSTDVRLRPSTVETRSRPAEKSQARSSQGSRPSYGDSGKCGAPSCKLSNGQPVSSATLDSTCRANRNPMGKS